MTPEQFKEWLCREMPAGTIIGDPAWWAPRSGWSAGMEGEEVVTCEECFGAGVVQVQERAA